MTAIPHSWSPKFRLTLALSGSAAIVILLDILPALRAVIQPLQELTAATAFVVLKASGLPVALDTILLTHPEGFRIAISYGCTPVVPAIILGILLTFGVPLSLRERLIGLSTGIALVTLLNLCRVTALYSIGVVAPGAFSIAHTWLGQGVIVVGTAMIALYWIGVSFRSKRPVAVT